MAKCYMPKCKNPVVVWGYWLPDFWCAATCEYHKQNFCTPGADTRVFNSYQARYRDKGFAAHRKQLRDAILVDIKEML